MTTSAVRVGVGTHFAYDGEVVKVVELIATPAGNEVLLKGTRDQRVRRVAPQGTAVFQRGAGAARGSWR